MNTGDIPPSDSGVSNLGAISLKIPTFWPEDADIWFSQTKAQFECKGITSSRTKYFHLVGSLNQSTARQLADLIRHPPQENPYEVLKARMLKLFTLSDYQRFEALINLPSQEIVNRLL